MVWQRGHSGPFDGLLASQPDLSVVLLNEFIAARSLVRSVVVSFGISNVQETGNASEAIDAIEQGVPDFAIVDDNVTSNGGMAFLRYIHRNSASPAPACLP